MIRITALFVLLIQTAACVPVFDYSTPETLTFDAVPAAQAQMNYADLMCCYDCTV